MAEHLMQNRSQQPIKVLGPCVGPLTFPLAMVEANLLSRNDELLTIDIDEGISLQADVTNITRNVRFNHLCADY